MEKPDTYPGGRGLTSDGIIFIIFIDNMLSKNA